MKGVLIARTFKKYVVLNETAFINLIVTVPINLKLQTRYVTNRTITGETIVSRLPDEIDYDHEFQDINLLLEEDDTETILNQVGMDVETYELNYHRYHVNYITQTEEHVVSASIRCTQEELVTLRMILGI